MSDRYSRLTARALATSTITPHSGEGPVSGASMDDAEGRGDVAPPAISMPRSMSSRCLSCGKDLSVRDLKSGGNHCADHPEALNTPDPHTVPRPGGGTTMPRPPMTKDSNGTATALGGPGSGPQPGGGHGATNSTRVRVEKPKGLLAKITGGLKSAGKAITSQYHIPERDKNGDRIMPGEKSGGRFKSRNEQNGPEAGVDYIAQRERK